MLHYLPRRISKVKIYNLLRDCRESLIELLSTSTHQKAWARLHYGQNSNWNQIYSQRKFLQRGMQHRKKNDFLCLNLSSGIYLVSFGAGSKMLELKMKLQCKYTLSYSHGQSKALSNWWQWRVKRQRLLDFIKNCNSRQIHSCDSWPCASLGHSLTC